jgi:anaerobic nitric oxide reductase transcription regulator
LKQLSRAEPRSPVICLEPHALGLDAAVVAVERALPASSIESFQPLAVAVDECQRWNIRHAVEHCAGNWASAARLLGVDASNLHKLARRLKLK